MLFGKHRIFFLPTSPRRPQSEQMAFTASRASWRVKQLAHRIDSPGKGKNLTPQSTQRSASARLLAFFPFRIFHSPPFGKFFLALLAPTTLGWYWFSCNRNRVCLLAGAPDDEHDADAPPHRCPSCLPASLRASCDAPWLANKSDICAAFSSAPRHSRYNDFDFDRCHCLSCPGAAWSCRCNGYTPLAN